MRKIPHPRTPELSAVLYALSDPIRLRFVQMLDSCKEEKMCSEFHCHLSKPTMSHHFKVLREAGITKTRLEGTKRLTSVCRKELDRAFPGLLNAVLKAAK